ncbi:hypothetical protein OQH60_06600 [Campylobacter sp. MIT 21-1685]|uniref:hypothetical protein n=1 Tax=unclassified Campylobacter TaxID=2593542 RepID=UPI00224A4C14|nr:MULTISPECIES: hypothetical protein [unclassified Campylobacter]MCX2683534.1 hypothetical protein [Campylobacter sp. MIT 21-1684]MCX2751805.1 hypothetical protein [Campylobacter sp. MIT 21-1682]MCX2808018.1 hypothetical protein [Campylobacter sp. MIT 21-1685]
MQNGINTDVIALANSYMSYANLIIVVAALIIAAITISLTIYYNRDKKRLIEETTHNILDKIANNEQMRNDFINKILENNNFKQEFERMVDIHISDKMDRLVDEKQEQSNIGGLK